MKQFLFKRKAILIRVILLLLALIVLYGAVEVGDYLFAPREAGSALGIAFCLLYAAGVLLCLGKRFGQTALLSYVTVLLFMGLALLARFTLLEFETQDYTGSFHQWVLAIQSRSTGDALRGTIGDYNPPYFYILLLIGKLIPADTPYSLDLYFMKTVSIFFELVLAHYASRLASLKTERFSVRCGVFFGTLLLPTVLLNASFRVQCDAIYTAFGVGALYYGLRAVPGDDHWKRYSLLSYAFFALSFAFKLQAIYFLPMMLVFLVMGKLRFRDIWAFPGVFLLTLAPAVLAGRSILDALLVYVRLSSSGGCAELTLKCPNVFGLYTVNDTTYQLSYMGICIAGMVMIAFLLFLIRKRKRLTTELLLDAALLFALLIPMFLPHMHERYYFPADVLSIVYLVFHKDRWYVPLTIQICSFLASYGDVTSPGQMLNLQVLSLAMIILTASVVYRFYRALDDREGERP